MRLIKFLKSVCKEMKKVVWPNVHQTKRDTCTVIGTSIFFAIFFAIIDGILQSLLGLL
ncbi:preprotein translocase subunit SecE [Acetilactobacillus jinshanensis]|uniref:Protein translocase subunit SecE n=1 Tax=Acetilactobacillus jinshanensis TaxID=1720083 RepID=A0A4P6ZML6_9LACO|nr:preprotein translocase subunit SecE [Acetilactobacillus jinshanensis]QBP18847.1 preprotein translocase subunit SecE [Acetilactobacillus jinshanensis]URL61714.1 preprotein translocase subunit SecE [uncultured bacterium]